MWLHIITDDDDDDDDNLVLISIAVILYYFFLYILILTTFPDFLLIDTFTCMQTISIITGLSIHAYIWTYCEIHKPTYSTFWVEWIKITLEWHNILLIHTHNIKTNVMKMWELTFNTCEHVLMQLSVEGWDQMSEGTLRSEGRWAAGKTISTKQLVSRSTLTC